MSQLNDHELIQLVQEKLPDELSDDELEQLRTRLRESPELREALLGQLHYEEYLYQALGRFEVSIESILRRSDGPNRPAGRFALWLFVLLGLVAGGGLLFLRNQVAPGPVKLADAESTERTIFTEGTVSTERQSQPEPAPAVADRQASQPADTTQVPRVAQSLPATIAVPDQRLPVAAVPSPTDQQTTAPSTLPSNVPPLADVSKSTSAPVDAWRLEIEAEDFARGNVLIDQRDMGQGIGIIYADDDQPMFVEYDLDVPAAGSYRLDLRFASPQSRPLRVLLHNQAILTGIAHQTTSTWTVDSQTWFTGGKLELPQGQVTLRLESDSTPVQVRKGQFPAIDKLALIATFPVASIPGPALPPGTDSVPAVAPVEASTFPAENTLAQSRLPFPLTPAYLPQGDQWGIRRDKLMEWLQPVAGFEHRFHESQHGDMPLASIEGVLQLKASWAPNAILRFSAYDHFGLRLHFWNGNEGVTLQYSDRPVPWWGAYQTERQSPVPRPERRVLMTTAEGRMDQSQHGQLEIRWQAGHLVMSRGDLRLLTVPLSEPPAEVYFDGRSAFSGFAMYQGDPLPESLPESTDVPRQYLLRCETPAQLPREDLLAAGASVVVQNDDSLELTSERAKDGSTVTFPMPESGLCEYLFQVDAATPGTGIFLRGATNEQLFRVGYFREQNTKSACLNWLRHWEQHTELTHDLANQIVPFAGKQQWLRLIVGVGTVKCWISGDGRHWGRLLEPIRGVRGGCQAFGLYLLPGEEKRAITLRQIHIRELTPLWTDLPDSLLQQLPLLPEDLEPEAWLEAVLQGQPASADPLQWRHACALATLKSGASGELGRTILHGLISETIRRPLPVTSRLQFLYDAALIADTWDHNDGHQFAGWFELLARQLTDEGQLLASQITGQALLECPLTTTVSLRVPSDTAARCDLIELIYRDKWKEVSDLCRWLRFWNRPSHPHYQAFQGRDALRSLVELAEAGVQRALPDLPEPPPPAQPVGWRHPLNEQLSKEGYNILAEFAAAMTGKSYQDACQIITSAPLIPASGLLPDSSDNRLLMPLARALELAMRDHPPLQATMIKEFSAIGRIRVRQAIADSNTNGVLASTVQFTGTEAAAEASVWLGDQELAAGNFLDAAYHYRQALRSSLTAARPEIEARLSLIDALTVGTPRATSPENLSLTVGNQRFTGPEFQGLLDDLTQAHPPSDSQSLAADADDGHTVPAPVGWKLGRRIPFEGSAGRHPGNTHFAGTDTTGREFTFEVQDGWLISSNRFQINGFHLADPNRKWSTGLLEEEGDSQQFPVVPMRPLIWDNQIYVRRLTRQGPELACLELATGKVLWHIRPGSHVISDPLIVHQQLLVFFVEEPQIGLLQVSLANVDLKTGQVKSQRSQMQLRDNWGTKVPCSATASDRTIIACVGGTVLACDLSSEQLWLRRQTWVPAADQFGFFRQFRQPPLLHKGRIFASQPGVLAVEALDVTSGRQLWIRPLADLRRIVGVVSDLLVLETAEGLMAVRPETGETAWSTPISHLLEGQICGQPGGILVARTVRATQDRRQISLAWLTPDNGQEVGYFRLPELLERDPQLAEMRTVGDRLWLAWGHMPRDYRREIIELIPDGSKLASAFPDHILSPWTSHIPEEVRDRQAELLPGWTLLTRQTLPQTTPATETGWSETRFQTQATSDHPVILVRRTTVPDDGPCRLQMAFSSDQPCQIHVQVNGKQLLNVEREGQPLSDISRFDVDLSQFAGQTLWLQVAQESTHGAQPTSIWHSLTISD